MLHTSCLVGTPGLGYPLLLCLGKGLVVILNYIQTAGPLRSGILFPSSGLGRSSVGMGPGTPRVPEKAGTRAQAVRAPDLPEETGPPQGPGPLMGSRTPCIIIGPLAKERDRRPPSGWSGAATCLRDIAVWASILTFTHHCIHCGRWTSALI